MKIVIGDPGLSIDSDLTSVTAAILAVFLKPYNDLLAQMANDGRVTREEMNRLRQQTAERGARLGELVQKEMAAQGNLADD